MFMGTLHGQYYKKMIGGVSLDFSDPVIVGERIESILQSGKIQDAQSRYVGDKKTPINFQMENEVEINSILETHKAP